MDLIEYFLKKYKIIQKKYTHDPQNNNHINQYVDTIYVINLASNPVRRHYIKLMMEKMKINYTIIVVQKIHKNVYRYLQNKSKISIGEMGTYLSHMWCLRDALLNKYDKFIILEDDILFHKQFHTLFKQIVSKDYDFLMLGASHFNRDANYYKPKNQVYMPSFDVLGGNLLGAFATLYTNKSATFVYALRKKNITFFDYNLYTILKQFRKSSGICYPNLIAADISHSNLNHAFSITDTHNYYKKCYDTFNFQDYHFTYINMFIKYKFNNKKHLETTPKKALIYILLNFFNNNGDLVKDHIKLLDWDLFSLDQMNVLVDLGEKHREDFILYNNHENICPVIDATPGYLLTNPLMQFRYLCIDFLKTIRKISLPDFSPQSNLETVLIEYRKLPHIEFLIRNTIIKLGDKWSHTVVCGQDNYSWMKTLCSTISSKIRIINTHIDNQPNQNQQNNQNHQNNMTRDKYSTMLTTSVFWQRFHGEKLLIYQEDSCMFHGKIEKFLQYDYVGAPWASSDIEYGSENIGNGGFSLRSKQVMIDICIKYPIDALEITAENRKYINLFKFTHIPEDRYFSDVMNTNHIGVLCDWHTGLEFSEETYLNGRSLGGHQFWLKNHDWKTRMFKLHYEYTALNKVSAKYPYLFHKVILGLTDINDDLKYDIQKEEKFTKKMTSHLHCYNIEKFYHFYEEYLHEISTYTNIVVTYCTGNPKKIEQLTILKIPNKGMDIGGKFCCMHYLKQKPKQDYILFLHSKSNDTIRKYWFDNIVSNLKNIANSLDNNLDIGGYFPPAIYSGDNSPLFWFDRVNYDPTKLLKKAYNQYHYNNLYMQEIMQYLDLDRNDMTCFPGGNCYILKNEVATKLFGDKYLYNILNTDTSFDFNWFHINYNLEYKDIFTSYKLKLEKGLCGNNTQQKNENKNTFPDGMIEHVYERLLFLIIKSLKLNISILHKDPMCMNNLWEVTKHLNGEKN